MDYFYNYNPLLNVIPLFMLFHDCSTVLQGYFFSLECLAVLLLLLTEAAYTIIWSKICRLLILELCNGTPLHLKTYMVESFDTSHFNSHLLFFRPVVEFQAKIDFHGTPELISLFLQHRYSSFLDSYLL